MRDIFVYYEQENRNLSLYSEIYTFIYTWAYIYGYVELSQQYYTGC